MCCKCVCKKWKNHVLELYMSSKSPKCLLIYHYDGLIGGKLPRLRTLKLVEIEDKLDHKRLLCDPFMSLDMTDLFPEGSRIYPVGSINGLICFWEINDQVDHRRIYGPPSTEFPCKKFLVCKVWFWSFNGHRGIQSYKDLH